MAALDVAAAAEQSSREGPWKMGVFAWILGRARWSKKRRSKVNRWDRISLAPNLRVRRLEERRVLNADAAPVQALIVNAGTAAGDGHADTFVVEQHDNQVRVSINGKEVSNTPISQISTIKIQGSSDDDILIAEFKSGEPLAGLHLMFDGNGGKDSLVLNSSAPVNSVAYNFGASGGDHVDIQAGTRTADIGFTNVESVNDSLTAQSRAFNIQSGGQQVALSDAGTANDDRSQIDISNLVDGSRESIVFKNPTSELSLKTDASTDKADTVTLNGFDHDYRANTHLVGSSDDLLVVHGATDVGTGNLDLSAGTVRVESSLTTSHANVDVHATHEFLITSSGVLQNDAGNIRIDALTIEQDGAIVAHGGLVHLDSGDGGTTIVRGKIDVSQADASKTAGTVHVLGSQVGLFDNAQIDSSAVVGAGTVLIGGDYQGKNPAIRNALRTYVGPNAVIRADATVLGNGGKVIVWTDEVTRFYGTITARGGSQGGNGGFAEVSGKQNLDYRGTANLTAIAGNAGNLLLDPDVLIIGAVTDPGLLDVASADPIVAFGEGGATANISAAYLVAQLNLNLSNITLQANDEIDVNLPVVAGAASTLGLELDAPLIKFATGANIVLNHADLTIGNTKAGNVELDGNVLLSTAGGVGGPGDINIKGTVTGAAGTETLQLNSATGSIDVGGAVSNLGTLHVVGANNATFHDAVSATTLTLGIVTGTTSIEGTLTADTLTVPATVNKVSLTGNGGTIANAVAFANTGTLTLGQALGTQTFNSGFSTTGVGGIVTLNGLIQTSNDAIALGAVALGSNTTLDTNATTTAGDITIGAVTGGGFSLTLETGAGVAGADVTGAIATGVGTLALQNIGGTASFTGAITATSLTADATVNNVGLTGTGSAFTDLVTFAIAGTLMLGQGLGTQSFNGGLNTTTVGLLITLNGLIQSSNDPITFGDVTLGSNVTIDTNATTSAGDITLGAVTGGGFNLTLETGAAVAGADVNGTSVSGVGTLALQNIGGTTAFTGALNIATLTDGATVNNVSLTGTGSAITNLVTFSNTGTLVLGQALGTQAFNGGFNTAGVGGVVTLNGLLQTSNDPITIGPATLGSNTTLDTNATNGNGDITLGAITGGGFNLTLETGAGIAGADVTGTSVSGVGTLALQNIGGTASFTGAVSAATLTDPAMVNNLSLTGSGGSITNLVTFNNIGTLTLGQALGTQTYDGGFNPTGVGGLVTLNGVLQTSDDAINLGAVTLGSNTTLDTNATTTAGDITLGAATGGGFNLTLETGIGIAGADVSGTTVAGVGTLALQNIGGTAAFTGAIAVAALTDTATVKNLSLTGTGSVITNLVIFSNTGTLTLGQALGTQTYNGGFNTGAVGGVVMLNGLLQTSNDPIAIGPATLGSNTTLDTNAANGAGDITLGAITAGGFNLTLETGNAVAGADVTGTSVSGAGTLTLQNIGGTASFTGAITATTLNVPATVNNVSLTGTGSVITNLVTFANTGTLVLGQALGNQTYNGGLNTTAVTLTRLAGTIATSQDDVDLGNTQIDADTTIQTAGGAIHFTAATVSAGLPGLDLLLDSSTTVAAQNGGALTLGIFNNVGGQFVNDLTITTTHGAGGVDGALTLTGNILLDDNGGADPGDFTFLSGGNVIVTGNITIDTEQGNTSAGGAVDLGTSNLFADIGGRDLSIDTRGIGSGGNVRFGLVSDNGGLGAFINDLSVDTRSALNGVISLSNNILVDNNAADLGSVTLAGAVQLGASVLVDTEQGNTASGGAIVLTNAAVSATTPGIDLTLNSATSAAASNGGSVALGLFDNGGGQFVNDLTINGSATAGVAGSLTLGGNLSLDHDGLADPGDLNFSGGGTVQLTNNVTIDTENGNAGAGGNIGLGNGTIFGDPVGRRFTLDAQGLANGGNINFGIVGAGIGALLGQFQALTNGAGVLTQDNAITVSGATLASNDAAVKLQANVLGLGANITVTTGGNIVANSLRPGNDLTGVTIAPGVIVKTPSGQIGSTILTLVGGQYTALQNTATKNKTTPQIGPDVLAEIQANLIDSDSKNLAVSVDWRGGTSPPADSLTARIGVYQLDGSADAAVAANAKSFQHQYSRAFPPDGAFVSGGSVHTLVFVSGFAQGTIVLAVNGGATNVLDVDQTGGIRAGVDIPFAGLIGVNALPIPEPLPTVQPVRPVIENAVEIAEPTELPTQGFVPITAGVSSAGEERFYELRVVTFDKDGMPVEAREARIRLDDPRLKAINPFNPKLNRTEKFNLSKLPILFGRLPADHYRIYLIEDHTERLILDFTIQQGQPIEIQETESPNSGINRGATDPFRDEVSPPAPGANQDNGGQPAEPIPVKSGARNGDDRQVDPTRATRGANFGFKVSTSADAFAEKLGRTSFVSHGGIVVGAAAFAFARKGRWEQAMDRLMERFDRRRQSPSQQESEFKVASIDASSSNSTHNSL
jgi:hypothetical protein